MGDGANVCHGQTTAALSTDSSLPSQKSSSDTDTRAAVMYTYHRADKESKKPVDIYKAIIAQVQQLDNILYAVRPYFLERAH